MNSNTGDYIRKALSNETQHSVFATMQNLNNLFTFVQVVSHGGYAAAARITGVQTSTLSRHIANLEDFLQATLIYRSSRRFALTEVWAEYYRQYFVVLENTEAPIGGLGIASLPLWTVGDDIKRDN